MIGTTIGKYRVQDRIGRGGMGTVYLATDVTLHREVAIKVLNSELNDPEIARRFRSEAITVARLSHPGIATVYELFEHDSQWLMVMEFVKGETLEHVVERGGPMSVERAADLCVQALTALAHAHSMGVVHRDLKPANLMVTGSGLLKIMDFGIARVAGSEHLTTAGFMMGTPAYMAPEQVLGHEIDARADLYAMGVVLYRLATSKLPFKGDSPFAMAQSQVNDPPTPVRLMRDGLPAWVELVIGRALSKAPADRFQTADEFRETLKRGLAGLPMEPAPNAFTPPELLRTVAMATPAGGTGPTPILTSGQIPMSTGSTGQNPAPPMSATGVDSAADVAMIETVLGAPVGSRTGQGAYGPGQSGTGQIASSTGQLASQNAAMLGSQTGAMAASQTGAMAGSPTGAMAGSQTGAMAGSQTGGFAGAKTGAMAGNRNGAMAAGVPAQKKKSSMPLIAGLAALVVLAVIGAIIFRPKTAPEVAPVETAAPPPATDPVATAVDPNAVASTTPTPTPTVAASTPVTGVRPAATPTPTATTTAGTTPTPTPSAAASPSPSASATPPVTADTHVSYPDLKMTEVVGKKGQDRDIILTFVAGQVSITPKKGGAAVVTVPYRTITKGTYVRAKDPKWDESLAYPSEGLDLPGLLRGAQHWLVLQWKTGYVLLKLGNSNFEEIIGTVEARSNIKVDRPVVGK